MAKIVPLGLHGGVGVLIEDPPHLAIAIRAAGAVIDTGALLMAGTRADPRGEMFGRWKRRGSGTDFRDDPLRRIDAQARDFGQPLDWAVVFGEQSGYLLIELGDLLVDHADFD
jgi:hypothetical protein